VPYGRFRDTHLAHHHDPILTDPYDDPESNYLDPAVWARLPAARTRLFRFNNTLFGRMVLGPILGNILWLVTEWKGCSAATIRACAATGRCMAGAAGGGAGWLWLAAMPWWAYLLAAWIGHAC
jgi:fatty acid desaturase